MVQGSIAAHAVAALASPFRFLVSIAARLRVSSVSDCLAVLDQRCFAEGFV